MKKLAGIVLGCVCVLCVFSVQSVQRAAASMHH